MAAAFGKDELVSFEFIDALFIGGNHAVARSGNDPIQQLRDFRICFGDGRFRRVCRLAHSASLQLPCIAQHGFDQARKNRRGLQFIEQRFERAFDLRATNGLAMADAVLVEAHIVRMLVASFATCPTSGQRMIAVATLHASAQREVGTDIGTRGSVAAAFQPLLNTLELRERDQALMLAFAERDAPFGTLNHACIDHAIEDAIDRFNRHRPEARLGKIGLAFKVALHFRLRLEPSRRIANQAFLNDRGKRFIAHEHVSMSFAFLGAIAPGRIEGIIARANARFHAVARLLRIFDARMLTHGRKQMLDELAVAVFAKFDGRAFKNAARLRNGSA